MREDDDDESKHGSQSLIVNSILQNYILLMFKIN
jgi:hypothetical protein